MDLSATVYAPPRAKAPWRLEELYAPATLRHYGHGRNALAEALRLVDAAGSVVLLPAFVCREVLAAVADAGAKPAFYGVKPDLSPDEAPERWPTAKAVLTVDYFGWPQDLTPFEAYARRSGAVVIEDAAHALFSRDGSGRLLGTRAPFGILSPRKSLPLTNGGTLLAANIVRLPPQLPFEPIPGRRPALKAALRPFLGLAGARAAHAALTAWRSARAAEATDKDSELFVPSASPCPELERPLVCADPTVEASRRRALWSLCDGLARKAGLTPVFPNLPDGVVPYAYAFRSADFAVAAKVFAAEGLPALPWPELPAAVSAAAPAHYRDLALAHFLW